MMLPTVGFIGKYNFASPVSMLTASAGIPRVELPDGGTLTTQQCRGSMVTNKGQDDNATVALDAIFEGANLMVAIETTVAKYFRIAPDGSEVIIFDDVTLTGGYYVGMASAVAGGKLAIVARYEDGTLIWDITTVSGTWAAQS